MMDHVALRYLMGCYRENESQALLCSSQWKEEGKWTQVPTKEILVLH